jgi:metal-sulfur cluster biosynthetic enzyme
VSEPPADLLALVHERVDEIMDPCSVAGGTPMGLSEMGLIGSVDMSADGDIAIVLRLTAPFCHMIAFLQSETVARVGALPGVRSVTVTTDQGLDWSPSLISGDARRRREQRVIDIELQTTASGRR